VLLVLLGKVVATRTKTIPTTKKTKNRKARRETIATMTLGEKRTMVEEEETIAGVEPLTKRPLIDWQTVTIEEEEGTMTLAAGGMTEVEDVVVVEVIEMGAAMVLVVAEVETAEGAETAEVGAFRGTEDHEMTTRMRKGTKGVVEVEVAVAVALTGGRRKERQNEHDTMKTMMMDMVDTTMVMVDMTMVTDTTIGMDTEDDMAEGGVVVVEDVAAGEGEVVAAVLEKQQQQNRIRMLLLPVAMRRQRAVMEQPMQVKLVLLLTIHLH